MGDLDFGPFAGTNSVSIFDGSQAPAPSGGGGSVGGNWAKDFNESFVKAKNDSGSCMEEILRAMQYRAFGGTGTPNNPFAIDTPQVPASSYWFIHALSVEFLSGAGSANANILLMPPNLAGAPADLAVTAGIRIENQNAVSGGTVQLNPNGTSLARNIVVPPRWFVRFLGKQGAGGPANYEMRLMFAELPLSFDARDLLS
jgi:hypothetical protein